MLPCGCKPDGMTYGILISAYDKGNQWCLALQVLSILAPAAPVAWTLLHVAPSAYPMWTQDAEKRQHAGRPVSEAHLGG